MILRLNNLVPYFIRLYNDKDRFKTKLYIPFPQVECSYSHLNIIYREQQIDIENTRL